MTVLRRPYDRAAESQQLHRGVLTTAGCLSNDHVAAYNRTVESQRLRGGVAMTMRCRRNNCASASRRPRGGVATTAWRRCHDCAAISHTARWPRNEHVAAFQRPCGGAASLQRSRGDAATSASPRRNVLAPASQCLHTSVTTFALTWYESRLESLILYHIAYRIMIIYISSGLFEAEL